MGIFVAEPFDFYRLPDPEYLQVWVLFLTNQETRPAGMTLAPAQGYGGMMRYVVRYVAVAALALGVSVGVASAAPIAVSSASPEWVLLPNSIGNGGAGTWGLPAVSAQCGSENEPVCEPAGVFLITDSFVSSAGYGTINDPEGTLSDLVTYDNLGPGGMGRIRFYSNPNPDVTPTGVNLGLLCVETANGCSGQFSLSTTTGALLTIAVASDNEIVFDPFGYGFDTSDQIRFSGEGVTVTNPVPEPASMTLLGTGLLALARRRIKKA